MANKTKSAAKKATRQRSIERLKAKKDRNVKKSSHGKFNSVKEFEDHRKAVSK